MNQHNFVKIERIKHNIEKIVIKHFTRKHLPESKHKYSTGRPPVYLQIEKSFTDMNLQNVVNVPTAWVTS